MLLSMVLAAGCQGRINADNILLHDLHNRTFSQGDLYKQQNFVKPTEKFMKKVHKVFTALTLLTVSVGSQANDLITLEAIKYYAVECYKSGGASYINQGLGWDPIDAQEVFAAAKHGKSLALINATMNGEKLTEQQLTQYLNEHAPAVAQSLERANKLQCEGGRVSLTSAPAPTKSAQTPTEVTEQDWLPTGTIGAEYYFEDVFGEEVRGFGRITDGTHITILSITARCDDAEELFNVINNSDADSKEAGRDKRAIEIKHEICAAAYGRSYNRYGDR